jgi:pantoate--beta-alanine ligase
VNDVQGIFVGTKLFNIVQPERAYFGQKDAQQVAVLRQMVRDLAIPVLIIVVPTVREADGLALSSRNVYLSPDQRKAAPVLYRALMAAQKAYQNGSRDPEMLRQAMHITLGGEPLASPDYISVADIETLIEVQQAISKPVLLSLAVRFGKTRLIDNITLGE